MGRMSSSVPGPKVVQSDAVIVPPKTQSVQVKFRWPPDIGVEIAAIAKRTNRSMNEAGELLMRWAIERAKQELDAAGDIPSGKRK